MHSFFLCLVLTTGLWAKPAPSIVVNSKAEIDLSNLFYSFNKINWRDYSIPSEVAHPYTIKVTSNFPSEVSGISTTEHLPEGQYCHWGGCRTTPATTVKKLVLQDTGMRITWDIIDDLTNKKVASYSEYLKITLQKEGTAEHAEIEAIVKGNVVNVSFLLPGTNNLGFLSLNRNQFVNRLRDSTVDVRSIRTGRYEIQGINFSKEYLTRISRLTQGASFEYDRQKNNFYFGVSESNADSPYLEDVYVR